jgi:hypothetical protein
MAACVLTSNVAAQAAQPDATELAPATEAQQRLAEARANLKLKPEQQSQVCGLRAVQQDFRGQLSTILTPEQMLHWDLMRDEVRQYAREHLKENAALEEF